MLHDDHVGRLSLPRGRYRITILASGRPSCAQSSALFTRFLEDYDGILPGGWRVAAASSTFLRAPGVGFHVAPAPGATAGAATKKREQGGGGRHPLNGSSFCPAPFRVLHNDRIGALRLAKGDYWIVLLQRRGLNCAQAERPFRALPRKPRRPPAAAMAARAADRQFFLSSAGGVGFRIKPVGS